MKMGDEKIFDKWVLDNQVDLMSDFIERKAWDEWQDYLDEEFKRWSEDRHPSVQGHDRMKSPESSGGIVIPWQGGKKMKFDNEPLDKEMLDRLENHQVILSDNCPPMNKEKALVLLGEALLNEFVEKFTRLWREELFPHCLLKDHEARPEDVHRWIHGG